MSNFCWYKIIFIEDFKNSIHAMHKVKSIILFYIITAHLLWLREKKFYNYPFVILIISIWITMIKTWYCVNVLIIYAYLELILYYYYWTNFILQILYYDIYFRTYNKYLYFYNILEMLINYLKIIYLN